MSLAHHAKSAVLWNASFNLLREVFLRVGSIVIFRRLLDPADYGVFDFVNSVVGFLGLFAFNNFVAHTVQVREEKDAHWQTHFTAGGFFQLALCALVNLVAFALRWLPQFAEFAPYLHAMSLLFLFDWPCEFRRKMLERAFDWQRLRTLHALAIIIAFMVQLNLALAGGHAYALLLPVFVMTLPFAYDLFVRARWRPDWSWSWENYQPAWNFGWTRVASGLAFNGRRLIERGVIVAVLGKSQLGILGGALGLAQVVCQGFAEQLLAAIYPVLTRVNADPQNISRVNALVLRIVVWVTVPLAVVSSALAGPLLLAAYGGKWAETIPLLPPAMLAGVAIAVGQAANNLLLAQNKLRLCLIADVLVLAGTILTLLLLLPLGLKNYLFGVAASQFVVLVLMLAWLVRGNLLQWRGVVSAGWPALLAAAFAYLVCEGLVKISRADASRFGVATVYGMVFTLSYLAVLRVGFRNQLVELLAYVPQSKIIRRVLLLGE